MARQQKVKETNDKNLRKADLPYATGFTMITQTKIKFLCKLHQQN